MDVRKCTDSLMESDDTTVTIERALELTGFGKYTILFTLACGLCICGATADIYSVGFILPAAECDLELDTGSKSLLAGAGITGMILSANIWGFLSDIYGRRKVVLYSGIGGITCSLVAMLSQSFWPFVIFRSLSGAFITGALTSLYAYFGEFMPLKFRSKAIVFLGVLQNLNSIYIPALAWLLLPLHYSFTIFGYEYNTWRIFLLLNTLPLFLGTVAIYFFPESPKFLLSNGNLDGTIEVLRKIYSGNQRRQREEYPVKKVLEEGNDEVKIDDSSFFGVLKDQIVSLFSRKHLVNTLSTSYLQFGNFAVSSGLQLWYADILNIQNGDEKNLSVCESIQGGKNATSSCDNTFNESMFTQNLWIGLLYMIGQLVIIFALKYLKKTFLQGICVTIAGLCAMIMMFVTSATFINILFVTFLVLPGLCVVIVNALVIDLFPTHLRSSAISFSVTMGRISTVITTSIVGYLIHFNCHATFFIYAGSMISCAVVAFLMRSKDKPATISDIRKAYSSGLFMWYPEIVNHIEEHPFQDKLCHALASRYVKMDALTCVAFMSDSVYLPSIIVGAALAVLYIISGTIINRIGAKQLLIIILAVSAGCGIASQYLVGDMWPKILMGIFLLSSAGIGIINIIAVELYPTQLRGMALAISLMAGRFGAVTGSNITGQLVYKWCEYTFYVFAIDHLILIVVTILLPTPLKARRMIEPIT